MFTNGCAVKTFFHLYELRNPASLCYFARQPKLAACDPFSKECLHQSARQAAECTVQSFSISVFLAPRLEGETGKGYLTAKLSEGSDVKCQNGDKLFVCAVMNFSQITVL